MRLLGLNITREKSAAGQASAVDNRGWWPLIREAFTGAWQQNVEVKAESVLAYHAVFACQTLIASDISKLRCKLVRQQASGIWQEVTSAAYSPVLRKPNHYQNRIQFFESWVLSKLQTGNTYILKVRDGRNRVKALYVLAPDRCRPLVADNGDVYYALSADKLSGLQDQVTVPASEIIHDRFNCFFHPLVGLSPIYANGLTATQGLAAQNSSARLFQNGARPGGVLIAPGNINDETAKRLKDHWDNNFTGANAGKTAVLGDGLKFEPMTMKSADAQIVEQLKWSGEVVCSTYHVPSYKIGAGQMPTVNNVQSLNVEYYTQCLQALIEAIELCLDEGLGTGEKLGTEFDLDGLLRMDTLAQAEVTKAMKGTAKLNEQRRRLDLEPIEGGETIYLQEQDHSLAAIAARDAQLIAGPPEPTEPVTPPSANDNDDAEATKALLAMMKGLA